MTAPGQLRRQARRVRRYGIQPMIIMGDGERLPATTAVVIGRFLWRYRSELGPGAFAALLFATGLALHATRPGWWPWPIAAAAFAAAAAVIAGKRLGLPTRAERAYAAAVILSGGAWLAAAAAAGPKTPPLPFLLAAGGLLLSVPWWAHRRRRARVWVERKLEAWPVIAQAVGLTGSRVMEAVVDMWGWHARFGLARGQTIDDVRNKVPGIESGLGTFRGAVRVYPTPDNLAHRFELRVLDKDPHADAIPWPGQPVTTITQPVDLGPFEDAAPATVLFLRRHTLAGGTTGSGKSGCINVIMANLTACTDTVIWAIDLKQGMELAPWTPCLGRLATTPAQARALLADAAAIVGARARHLAAAGKRTWEPSPARPALVIVIDEYAELASLVPTAAADTDSIARLGRAVAVTLVAATQRPTQQAMGQRAVRSQMDVRIAFRVRERRDTDLILGPGMLSAGWHAHTLNAPGKFLISAPEYDTPRRARAYLLTDEVVAATAARHALARPGLDEVSAQAIAGRAQFDPDSLPSEAEHGQQADPFRDDTAGQDAPEVILWATLALAPAEGVSVARLMTETGMGRRWVYYRLRALAGAGRVTQTSPGMWRTIPDGGDSR
jgi:FtsK/SpoIIIE family